MTPGNRRSCRLQEGHGAESCNDCGVRYKNLEKTRPTFKTKGGAPAADAKDAVAFTKKYLETFDEVRNSAADMDTFVAEMKKRFPGLAQVEFLSAAAKTSYHK